MIFVGGGQGWFGIAIVGLFVLLALPVLVRWFFGCFVAPRSSRDSEFDPSIHSDRMRIPGESEWSCREARCRRRNPGHARFCRNCGLRRPPRELFDRVA